MNKDLQELLWDIGDAVAEGKVDIVRQMIAADPGVLPNKEKWLDVAASIKHLEMVRMLLDLGCDVNEVHYVGKNACIPLDGAISSMSLEIVEEVLRRGADPNFDRQVISCITCGRNRSLDLVRLLERYGADIHRVFTNEHTNQLMNALSTAIEWGKQDVADYLRTRGAALPEESPKSLATADLPELPNSANAWEKTSAEVVAYFAKHFGPVDKLSLMEIVPTEPRIVIHVVPATNERKVVTLFTTGLSDQPMAVPADLSNYRYAEVFLQLPAAWNYRNPTDAAGSWPILWLRKLAIYPLRQATSFGGPIAIMSVGNGKAALPGTAFTAIFLMCEQQFTRSDGNSICLYRATPLYAEEHQLAKKQGVPALMRAFDAADVPFVVDPQRRNVAN